jgi:NADH dehydrogenase [ubiquinone] 1 alpha subcomplex assembly factor 7
MAKAYMNDERFSSYKDGDRIEISPDSWQLIDKIAKYLERNGGSGLAIDYGQDYIQGHTLRVKYKRSDKLNSFVLHFLNIIIGN